MNLNRTILAGLLLASPALAQTTNDPFPTPIRASEGVIRVDYREFARVPDIDGQAARMMLPIAWVSRYAPSNVTRSRMMRAALTCLSFMLVLAQRAHGQDAQMPKLENAARAAELLKEQYPEDLRLLGFGGTVKVNVRVDLRGGVDSVVVLTRSGLPALDDVAEGVARSLRFSKPATPSWVDLDLTFQPERSATTVFSALPHLTDRRMAQETVWLRLPERLRKGTIRATRLVEAIVDSTGKVLSLRPAALSCPSEFDEATMAGSALLRFAPLNAAAGSLPQRTIVTFDFHSDSVAIHLPGESRRAKPLAQANAEMPSAMVPAQAPRLRNRDHVSRTLQRHYPPELRSRGAGGTVALWLFIDEKGDVKRRMIRTSSGLCALDRAALEVSSVMRFEPALRDGVPTKVWVQMPVVFQTR